MIFKTCSYCGAHLDPDEKCDCRDEPVAMSQQENEPAGGNRTGSEQ